MGEGLRSVIRRFNKHVTNRITARIAGSTLTPFAMVQHVGRRSGKTYHTPIIVQPTADGFVIALTYGPNVDWYRNVLAAGTCQIRWHRRNYAVSRIEPIDADSGLAAFPFPLRPILRALGNRDFVQLRAQVV